MYPSRNKSELNQRISFLCLPNELLCHIFGFLTGFGEVTNSMLTCRRFYDFFRRNKQWEKKILIAKNTREKIKMMSQLYYPIGEPSISLMDKLLHDANSIPNFIETMLSQYVFSYERTANLTWKYYATKVLLHFRKRRLENKIIQLMKLPSNQISLVKGALLISQWGQVEEKCVSSNQVFYILEGITNRVREIVHMKTESTDTPYAFSIIEAIQRVLYHDMGFTVNECDYGPFDNYFIEKVLFYKRGHPIMMIIIIHELAIQMGITCSLVLLASNSFLLACKNGMDDSSYIGIQFTDVSKKPAIFSFFTSNESFSDSAEDIFQSVLSNLIASSWDTNEFVSNRLAKKNLCKKVHFSQLAWIISPQNILLGNNYITLCYVCCRQQEDAIQRSRYLKFDHWAIEGFCKHLQSVDVEIRMVLMPTVWKIVHQRHLSIRYAVGMVMQYTRNIWGKKCLCVISMWSVHFTSSVGHKIMYTVLFEDGTSSVVEEGDLKIHTENVFINHPDLGIYFQHFDGSRYIPNSETAARFPEDEKILNLKSSNVN